MTRNYRGYKLNSFTLIELLIVIVIIGILSVALIPRVMGIQNRARYMRVDKDFQDFKTAVFIAQTNTQKPLVNIINNTCPRCACRDEGVSTINKDIRSISQNGSCRNTWIQSLRKIEEAAGMLAGSLASLETDPWGSPYLLDANDGESTFFAGGGCVSDTLGTAGPDGNMSGLNRSVGELALGDNRGISIAAFDCSRKGY